jgi:hypothetical protein
MTHFDLLDDPFDQIILPFPSPSMISSSPRYFTRTIKRKYHLDGIIFQYKAQLVAHEFTQIQGIDYGETFSPLVKITSLKIMIALASAHNLHFHQMDMKITFLNGTFNEKIYMF